MLQSSECYSRIKEVFYLKNDSNKCNLSEKIIQVSRVDYMQSFNRSFLKSAINY